MKTIITYISFLLMFSLFGCSGSAIPGDATLSMTLSAATIVAGGSVSSTSQITTTRTNPINNIDITYSSNRPDLIHFAANTATNSGGSSITVKTNAKGIGYVVLNIDNSVAIPLEGIEVSISASSSGLTSIQQLTVKALPSSGGTVAGTSKISLTLGAASIQDNSGQTIATATVTSSDGIALSGQAVSFTISPATGPAAIMPINGGITDSNGKAYATVTGSTTLTNQNIFIYATVSGITTAQQLSVVPTVTPPPATSIPKKIVMGLASSSLQSSEQTILTANVTDGNGLPLAYQTVEFSVQPAGSHALVAAINGGVTDSNGNAYASVTATNATTTENIFIYATTGATPNIVSYSTELKVSPSPTTPTFQYMSLLLGKSSLQTSEQTTLTVTVTDAKNAPVSNQTVTFNVQPSGAHVIVTPIASGITDSTGKAYAVITATTASSIENIFIYTTTGTNPNLVNGSIAVQILPQSVPIPSPSASKITMTPDKLSIQPNGQALLSTIVTDSTGAVLPNEVVTFTVISGPLTITSSVSATTGNDGKVMAVVQASATTYPTYALIKASTANGTTQTISIGIAPLGKPQLLLSIAKPTIDASDKEVLATIEVLDSSGAPVIGQSVTFSNVSGPFTIDSTLTTVVTGNDGKATTKLTPTATAFASNMLLSVQLTYQGAAYSLVATALINPIVTLTVALDSTTVDTVGQIIATATATTANGTPLVGQTITFNITGPGTIVGSSTSTATDGTSKAVITHDNNSNIGNIIIEATITYGGVTYSSYATAIPKVANMMLSISVQSGFTPTYSIGATSGPLTDSTTTTVDGLTAALPIKAKFTYLDGTPVPNQTITFTALDPGLFWGSAGGAGNGTTVTATTTTSGDAYVVAVPGSFSTSGFIHIQASTVINGVTYIQVMPIAVQATQVHKLFTLDKATLVISPNSSSTVNGTFNLKDSSAVPLIGKTVTFTILSGPASILSVATTMTDGSGNAVVLINATGVSSRETIYVNASVTINGVDFNTVASFTVDPSVNLALTTDLTKVDGNGGQVVATGTLTDSSGAAISGQTVTFSLLTPTLATIQTTTTPITSVSGKVSATIRTAATDSTQNVLVQASTLLAGVTYTQITSFQVTKGVGTLVITAPATTSSDVAAPFPKNVTWLTSIPVKLLDANGNPRTNVPITLSVIASDRSGYQVATDSSGTYSNSHTVNTDSAGIAFFTTKSSTLTVNAAGGFDSSQVVWQATTNDTSPVLGFATSTYSLTGI